MTLKHEKMKNLLYRSFDSSLTPQEQEELDNALENSSALKNEKLLIEKQRKAISQYANEFSFNPFFAQQVINRINTLTGNQNYGEIFANYLLFFFKRMALVSITICLIMISYNVFSEEILKFIDFLFPSPVTYEAMLKLPLL
ncbi:MAG: hypothetical protein MUF15_14745 [Acidobacteria bacterium]|jgi:hypothetical protein|nr:hypothetical protein [Acidobacteriota bacterium]